MWTLPSLETRSASGPVDTDVVIVFQDAGKKALPPEGPYSQVVERFRKSDAFNAKHGSIQFIRFGGKDPAENVLLAGIGPAGELTEEKARMAGGTIGTRLAAEKSKSVAIHIDSLCGARGLGGGLTPVRLAYAFAEGLVLSGYKFDKYKSKGTNGNKERGNGNGKAPSGFIFVSHDKTLRRELESGLLKVLATAEAVNLARDWSNEPSNFGTPEHFAATAQKLARQAGLKCQVLTEREAAREKMGLFLGVGRGSEREGRIVVLEYLPKAAKKAGSQKADKKGLMKTVALVGKGITFDSGGISIKPSARMEEMKHDMSGAATVMGAILLAAKWKVPNRVLAILAFTENMPDGTAIQPGNVLYARSGKSVEVINTDAEGRLILADALDFAQDFEPDAVIDVATLTGAVAVALGKLCCGILGNDEALIEAVKRAGERNGERIWQLPLFEEYFEDLKSDCADMKNSANDSYGGTIRGAIFLKQFIRKGVAWAHLDIAATAWGLGHLPYVPKKGASGAYVRTLAQFAADF